MRVDVLGTTAATVDGRPADLGGRRQRALLAALVLGAGRPVAVDALVASVWGTTAPPGAAGTLQTYVAGLRRVLEPDRAARAPAQVLVTVPPGYALRVEDVDARAFASSVDAAARVLRPVGHAALPGPGLLPDEDVRAAHDELRAALRRWRGTPYLDLGDDPGALAERARLEELRVLAEELAAAAALALGEEEAAVGRLEALTAEHPLRERLWTLRATALARSGRQADALEALRALRTTLADELGLDPGPQAREVEQAVLRQDDVLRRTAAPPAASEAGAFRPTAPTTGATTPPDWPLVGRDEALAQLTALVDEAVAGAPRFAALVGDPGIGKTRLAEEVLRAARDRGAAAVVAAGSQDEGAPPLWPWTQVLRALGAAGPGPGPDPGPDPTDGAEAVFTSADAVAQALRASAAERPLVLVLDDLQWVDTASQRVLRHVVRTVRDARLCVLVTWRAHPPPTGSLAETADALARRHALRVDLTGLGRASVAELVGAVSAAPVTEQDAERLRSRTDGNPFFLVEYARLHRSAGPGAGTRRSDPSPVPSAVSDVVGQRVAALPDASAGLLAVASVLGRDFDVRVLASVLDLDEDTVLERLEPARAVGLVRDLDVDRVRFDHALVRDALYDGIPLSRRGRLHARAAAALDGGAAAARRETAGTGTAEVALHWLAAGDRHATRAWRAAVAAANAAAALDAREEEAALLAAAVRAARLDPGVDDDQRYDLLMAWTAASRHVGDLVAVDQAVDEAIGIARRAGDLEREVAAAVAPSEGALWQTRAYGTVHRPVVDALRHALGALPTGDGAERCQVMLSLASELYYSASARERDALCDEAVAMARRLADPALLQRACQVAFVAVWRASTASWRLALAEEALAAGRAAGDADAAVVSLVLRAVAHVELGAVAQGRRDAAEAAASAGRARLAYAYVVVQAARAPLAAMAGRLAEAFELVAEAAETADRTSLPQVREGIAGALLVVHVQAGQGAEVVTLLRETLERSRLPVLALTVALVGRYEGAEPARDLLADRRIDLDTDDWFSPITWSSACEVGFRLGLPGLAARAYERCAPLAGRMACAGSGAASGPVDIWLAYGAAATGQRDLARRHADDAARLLAAAELPLAGRWWAAEREQHGF